ncbi:hypothetical protein R6Q57_025587 [Mikania cordata]
MSSTHQPEIPVVAVAHPPPMAMAMEKQGPVTAVPAGYPTTTVDGDDVPTHTRSKGDGFWKGCCAALCCCCLLDACF